MPPRGAQTGERGNDRWDWPIGLKLLPGHGLVGTEPVPGRRGVWQSNSHVMIILLAVPGELLSVAAMLYHSCSGPA